MAVAGKQITDLPVAGRNIYQLAWAAPGIVKASRSSPGAAASGCARSTRRGSGGYHKAVATQDSVFSGHSSSPAICSWTKRS